MSPQASIGHYRVIAKLGEGGMGVVYRATDTRLHRDVAIKVLPEVVAQDTARMQRFEREAQVLASLNHPNIAAIYGVEQGAIVMELVEGGDLAGPLPAGTVVDYARQMAAGLEAAHEKGIIHRDLKPANISVTPEGVLKILDFGLAKATDESASHSNITKSPTISMAMTQAGAILGTAAYMSPEQARGKTVDRRADIWAYGVILFELLTGHHPYAGGETVTDTLAAIVLKEPDLTLLPPDTPPRVRWLIERCLRKDPKQRLRDIGEARILLEEPDAGAVAAAAIPAARRAWLPWTIAIAGVAAALATAVWMRPSATVTGPGTIRFSMALPPDTLWPRASGATNWVPSPDGRNLAMVLRESSGDSALWVRPMNAATAHRLDKTEGANYPFWSPDGQWIAFFADNKIKKIGLSGGAVQKICDLPGVASAGASGGGSGDGGAWNQDGVIVFAAPRQPLQRVSASGGTPAPLTVLEKDEAGHSWPQFLPDGRHVLYLARSREEEKDGIYVQELGSTKRVLVMRSPMRASWSPPGYLLFYRESSLFAQRMNPRTFQLEGEAQPVAEDVGGNESNGRTTAAVSQNGVLVYRSGTTRSQGQMAWRDYTGKVLHALGKPAPMSTPRLSPNDKLAAVLETRGGDLWVMDTATGVTAPLTHNANIGRQTLPVWSPDSKRVAIREGDGFYEIDAASGKSTLLTKEDLWAEDWSPDGNAIVCRSADGTQLYLLPMAEGHKPQTVITSPYRYSNVRFSPDGRYVVYGSTETGRSEVWVASFPSFSVKRRISSGGGVNGLWAASGKQIVYKASNGDVTEVEVRTGADITVGNAKVLFRFPGGVFGSRFSMSSDGRFLSSDLVSAGPELPSNELLVVVNWMAELKKQ